MNKVPRWVFRYVGNKTFDFSSKKKDFLPQNDQIWPKIGTFGQLCALLVSWLVVVARGLYLARHLFTLFYFIVLDLPSTSSYSGLCTRSCRRQVDFAPFHRPVIFSFLFYMDYCFNVQVCFPVPPIFL